MTLTRLPIFLVLFMLIGGATSLAKADILIEFSDGTNIGNSFEIGLGISTFEVWVTETSPNTDLSVDGLIGFGLHADYVTTTGTDMVITSATVNPDFDLIFNEDFTANTLEISGSTLLNPEITGTSILLAEFDVTVTGDGTAEFVFDDLTPGSFSDFVTSTGTDLDPILFAGGRTFALTLNATSIPEPAMGITLVLGTGCVLLSRRSR